MRAWLTLAVGAALIASTSLLQSGVKSEKPDQFAAPVIAPELKQETGSRQVAQETDRAKKELSEAESIMGRLRKALGKREFESAHASAEAYRHLGSSSNSGDSGLRQKKFALNMLVRISEASRDFQAAQQYRRELVEFNGSKFRQASDANDPARHADEVTEVSYKAQRDLGDLNPAEQESYARAVGDFLQGEVLGSPQLLRRAHNQFLKLFGDDHEQTIAALLATCLASDVSMMPMQEHLDFQTQVETRFGAESVLTADACLTAAKSRIKPIGTSFDNSDLRLLSKCEAIYGKHEFLNPNRQVTLHSVYAIFFATGRDNGNALNHLAKAESLIEDKETSLNVQMHFITAALHSSMMSNDSRNFKSYVERGQSLIDRHPKLEKTAPQSSFTVYAAAAFLGDRSQQTKMADQFLERAMRVDLSEHPDQESVAAQRANVLFVKPSYMISNGNYGAAEESVKKLIPMIERSSMEHYPAAVRFLGEAQIGLAKYESAARNLGKAKAHLTDHNDADVQSKIYHRSGIAQFHLGEYETAISDHRKAIDIRLGDCKRNLYYFSYSDAQKYAKELDAFNMTLIGAGLEAARLGNKDSAFMIESALDATMQSKGIAAGLLRMRSIPSAGVDSLGNTFARFQTVRSKHLEVSARLRSALINGEDERTVSRLERQKSYSLQKLAELIPEQNRASFDTNRGKLEQLFSIMPDDLAVVEYVTYKQPGLLRTLEERYAAFVIRKPLNNNVCPISLVDIGSVKEVNELIEQLKNESDRRLRDFAGIRGLKISKPAKVEALDSQVKLSELVWAKIQPLVNGSKTIVFCPIDELSKVQWAGLVDPSDKTKFIAQHYEFILHDNSASVLEMLNRLPNTNTGFLSFGGIEFGKAKKDGNAFPNLDLSLNECHVLSAAFTRVGQTGKLLSGEDATKAAFVDHAQHFGTIHIASHGAPLAIRSPEQAKKHADTLERHPFIQNSIVFANANQDFQSDQGFLTGEEILELDLSKVSLALISTCESADGVAKFSEGVFGLEKAFRLAGAQATMTSISKLDDKHAGMFVDAFIRSWQEQKLSKAAAFQAAQKEMIEQGVPVELWSGWRLTGDFR